MKSFSKATMLRVLVSIVLIGGVLQERSEVHATSCDTSTAVRAASSLQPTSLSITGRQISRSSMNTLWNLTTSEDSLKFQTLGHAIGSAHGWMGNCTYPGLGIGNGSGFDADSKNVTLWLWQDGIDVDRAREAVYNLIGESEADAILDVQSFALTGDTVLLSASRTMSAFVSRSFAWDVDGNGTYEVSTGASPSLSASWSNSGVHMVGVKVTRSSGSFLTGIASIEVLKSSNGSTPGISILNGQSRTSTRDVTVSLVWPSFAREAQVSNDGAFHPMHTSTVSLDDSFQWLLEDAGEGVYTSTVYLRFIGPGLDATRTYMDTIVLNNTSSTSTTSTSSTTTIVGAAPSASTSTTTTTTPTVLSTTNSVNAMAQSTSGMQGIGSMSVRTLSARVARSSQKTVMRVLPASRKVCRVAGAQVVAIRMGKCAVQVSVQTVNGRRISRVVTFYAKR